MTCASMSGARLQNVLDFDFQRQPSERLTRDANGHDDQNIVA